jgi:HlyD family secretion protein
VDRVIEKKKWNQKRILTIVGIAALVILISASVYFANGKSRLNVAVERITISEVRKNTFQEFIPVNGTVQPIATIYLDALEGGRVEEKLVEDGTVVQKGQPIMRLSNTDLELSLANQETAVFQVLTQMQNTKNNAVQNSIQQLNQKNEVDNALAEAKRVFELNQHLYNEGVIGQQEFKASENNYTFQLNRKKLNERTLNQDSVSMQQQLRQTGETYARMQNTLALMRRKVEDLIVRAPIDGHLTSLDAEIGESKNKGARLGQIDVMSGFKVQVEVDEHYISRVFIGQQAEATFAGKKHPLIIKKVYSQVRNGRFQVDMEFVEGAPEGIRRGQTLQIRLALSDETQAVLLAKGGFYQQTGGNWVFKVSEDGSTAYRVDVQLGRQNPEYYEVLNGLQPGDRVVTSSYENWGNMQELVLK